MQSGISSNVLLPRTHHLMNFLNHRFLLGGIGIPFPDDVADSDGLSSNLLSRVLWSVASASDWPEAITLSAHSSCFCRDNKIT